MAKAIRINQTGGADVLSFEDVELPAPGKGEAAIRHTAIGVNFIDVYHRTGLYPQPLPFTLGSEGAGVVTAVGEGVTEVAVGDRVAYAGGPLGAYATERVLPADKTADHEKSEIRLQFGDFGCNAVISRDTFISERSFYASAKTPTIALILAALRALQAQEGRDG